MKALTLLIKPAAGLCNMHCEYCFYREASRERSNELIHHAVTDLGVLLPLCILSGTFHSKRLSLSDRKTDHF